MMDKHIYNPVWAEVDLDAIAHNLETARNIANNAKVLAVVKADAYGHGAVQVAKKLADCRADYLGVASLQEAYELRESGIKLPILVLGIVQPEYARSALELDLRLTLFTKSMIKTLQALARKEDKQIKVHIKIDTGMGRLGVWHQKALEFINEAANSKNIIIEGIFTHLSSADEDKEYTLQQLDNFNDLIEKLHQEGINIPLIHAANSMGVLAYKRAHFNMIRPGLMLYGLNPKGECSQRELSSYKLIPAMSFKTRVVWLKDTPKDRAISYGKTYITKKDTTLACLPVGYSHGYPRALSNKAQVIIKGNRLPVVGKICMDQTIVDVGGSSQIKLNDEVVLLGSQGKEKITAEELAGLCGTIPYEIVCWISRRVPRVYI